MSVPWNFVEQLNKNCRQIAVSHLSKEFPSVDSELLVDEAIESTAIRMGKDEGCVLNPCGYVLRSARNLAFNDLRRRQKQIEIDGFELLATHGAEPKYLEYRKRQGKTLGDIYREYVTFCEEKGGVWIQRRTVRECDLWERTSREISELLSLNSNAVYRHRFEDRQWWSVRMSANDIQGTVFQSFWNNNRTPETNEDFCTGAIPAAPASKQSVAFADSQPIFGSFAELHSWLVFETDAFCPSATRLQSFRESLDPASYPDLRFHINARNEMGRSCRFCKLEVLGRDCDKDLK